VDNKYLFIFAEFIFADKFRKKVSAQISSVNNFFPFRHSLLVISINCALGKSIISA